MQNSKVNILKEDEHLPGRPDNDLFISKAPVGYFDELPERIMQRISEDKLQRILIRRTYIRVASVAASLILIAASLWYLFSDPLKRVPAITFNEWSAITWNQVFAEEWPAIPLVKIDDTTLDELAEWVAEPDNDFVSAIGAFSEIGEDDIILYLLDDTTVDIESLNL